jgi:hypothetical protein
MKRLDVRCCCNPGLLLGTLPAPSREDATEVTFAVRRARDGAPQYVTLTVAKVAEPWGVDFLPRYSLAYKDNGLPIETLRLTEGFEEAT